MRNAIIYLTMLIQLSSFFIGCGKDNGTDDPNNPNGNGGEQTTLTISPNELTFKSEGEEKTFSITSNSDWIITNPSTWCKINPTQGNGNSTITAIADPSEEYDDRNFNLIIKAGETTKVVTVTQKKKDAIILTKEKYDIPTEGDNITVEVKSNISYSTIIPEEHNEWIKQVETKQLGRGLETKNLNFEISANPTTDKREGIIIIKDNSSSLADTIHVYQAQKDELILTQDTYNVSSEGENINVELRSNVDYEVIIPEDVKDWVNRITSRSSRVDNLIFNIAANPTYDNRSAKVIIKDKNSELADTLNINQTQVNAIILTQEKYEIPSEGQNIKIEVKSNIKYDIIIPDNAREWIKQIQSRALITNIINLSISENTSYEQRAAEIVVKDKNSNLSDTIRITQKQNNTIILTQKKYDIPAEGQQISIEIKSNIEYDILLSTDAEKWVEKIDLSRALATNTLNYNILPNTTYNERKAEIIIKDKGSDLSDTVKIIQNPTRAIIIEKKEYNISSKGGIVKVGIKSNIDYNIIIPSSAKTWITQIASKNLITDSLTFNISENSTYEKRKAEIIIRKDELVDTITICQEQNDAIILDTKIYNIPMEGKQISIKIQSNIDFEVIIAKESQSWIEQIEHSRSLSLTTFNFNIKQNPDYAERKGEIYIKDKNNNLSDTIKINQDAKTDIYIGNITFKTEQDLINFNTNGYKKIKGNLTISGKELITLRELDNQLIEIDGNLEIACSSLTSLEGLYGLTTIIGDLLLIKGQMITLEGLNNLTTIGGNFKVIASRKEYSSTANNTFSSLNELVSFRGLNKLNRIEGDFEINASSETYYDSHNAISYESYSLNKLTSFEGLESLVSIGGNFKVIASAKSELDYRKSHSLNQLTSFRGLSNLNNIGGNFQIEASINGYTSTFSYLQCLNKLTSFEGLENLNSIGGDLNISGNRQSLSSLISFNGLSKLHSIGGNFKIQADNSLNALTSFKGLEELNTINGELYIHATYSALNKFVSFEGLENLNTIGKSFQVMAYSASLDARTSFQGLNKLQHIGRNLVISAHSSLNSLNSFNGLENITIINGNLDISASSSNTDALKNLTSFKGLENLHTINGDFKVSASSSSSLSSSGNYYLTATSLNTLASFKGLDKLNRINGNFTINASSNKGNAHSLKNLISFEGLESLTNISGNFSIIASSNGSLTMLTSFWGLNKLDCISGNLTITKCKKLNNINALTNLSTVKDITITGCNNLYDFCVLKNIMQNYDNTFYTYQNGYDPTKYQLLNGECSKLPETTK